MLATERPVSRAMASTSPALRLAGRRSRYAGAPEGPGDLGELGEDCILELATAHGHLNDSIK